MTNITAPAHMIADAQAIKEQLRATEACSDELLFNTFETGKRLLTARRNPDVAPSEGQVALRRLVRAQQSILDAQGDIFRVHSEMNKIGVAVGVMDEDNTTPMGSAGMREEASSTTLQTA